MERTQIEYAIEVHCGFMISEWVEKIRNCRVTKEKNEVLKFKTQKAAKEFISLHDGDGLNKKTAKIISI